MNTVRDTYYFVEDLMTLLGLSRSKCYKIIKQLNEELEEQGYITISGRVPKSYCNQRFFSGLEDRPRRTNSRSASKAPTPAGATKNTKRREIML